LHEALKEACRDCKALAEGDHNAMTFARNASSAASFRQKELNICFYLQMKIEL
jgi:hypothetical protein